MANAPIPLPAPYKSEATNRIYNLLFCDSLRLYWENSKDNLTSYPFDILFSEQSRIADFQRLIDDPSVDSRIKVLARNRQLVRGHRPQLELLGVIIEVGLDEGLDVVASFRDGSARYINYSEKLIVWETPTDESTRLTNALFVAGQEVIRRIGPYNKPRRPQPSTGMVRLTFLVSDGLYFGEGSMNTFFHDPMAGPVLNCGMELMKFLIGQTER